MDINYIPEFDTVIKSYLEPVEKEIRQLELTRRLVNASSCKTEEDKTEILNGSEAFTYLIDIHNGELTVERVPHYDHISVLNDIIAETLEMAKTLLPKRIEIAMGEASPELANILLPQIKTEIMAMLQEVFQ